MLQRLGVVNPKRILQPKQKSVVQSFTTQAPATPPNEKKVLLFLILQLFLAYCNTFRALKHGQNLVVSV